MRIVTFALISVAVVGFASAPTRAGATPQQRPAQACLHGDDESPEQRARRFAALALARDVNTMEAMTAVYQPLANLALNRPTPDGFRLQLTTDGTGYAFSVKDTLDPCVFAYFSDQSGVILVGRAIQ
jgi:hypothetical protein